MNLTSIAMTRILTFALTFSLVLGAGVAGAADEKKKKKNEGPDLTAAFAKLDTNNDKKLSKDEFNSFHGLQPVKAGKENKEPKGLADARNTWFTKLDTNGDGSLTAAEFAKVKDVIAANPLKKKKKDK